MAIEPNADTFRYDEDTNTNRLAKLVGVANADGTPVGGATSAATGTTADAAVTDPGDPGTVIALLKGILTALNSIDAKTPAA